MCYHPAIKPLNNNPRFFTRLKNGTGSSKNQNVYSPSPPSHRLLPSRTWQQIHRARGRKMGQGGLGRGRVEQRRRGEGRVAAGGTQRHPIIRTIWKWGVRRIQVHTGRRREQNIYPKRRRKVKVNDRVLVMWTSMMIRCELNCTVVNVWSVVVWCVVLWVSIFQAFWIKIFRSWFQQNVYLCWGASMFWVVPEILASEHRLNKSYQRSLQRDETWCQEQIHSVSYRISLPLICGPLAAELTRTVNLEMELFMGFFDFS